MYDGTHLTAKGSVLLAQLVFEELRKAVPALSKNLLKEPNSTTVVAKDASYDALVSLDGSGTPTIVQAAIDAAHAGRTRPFVILLKPVIYQEDLFVPAEKPFITLRGDANELKATVITQDTNVGTVDANGKKSASATAPRCSCKPPISPPKTSPSRTQPTASSTSRPSRFSFTSRLIGRASKTAAFSVGRIRCASTTGASIVSTATLRDTSILFTRAAPPFSIAAKSIAKPTAISPRHPPRLRTNSASFFSTVASRLRLT